VARRAAEKGRFYGFRTIFEAPSRPCTTVVTRGTLKAGEEIGVDRLNDAEQTSTDRSVCSAPHGPASRASLACGQGRVWHGTDHSCPINSSPEATRTVAGGRASEANRPPETRQTPLRPRQGSRRCHVGRDCQLSATPSGSTSYSRTNTGGGSANAPHTTGYPPSHLRWQITNASK